MEHTANDTISPCMELRAPIVVICVLLMVTVSVLCLLFYLCRGFYNVSCTAYETQFISQQGISTDGFTSTDSTQKITEKCKTAEGDYKEQRTMSLGGFKRLARKSGTRVGYAAIGSETSSTSMLKRTHDPTYEDVVARSEHRTSKGTTDTTTRGISTSGSASGSDSERQQYERQNRVALKLKKAMQDNKDLTAELIFPQLRNEKLKIHPDDD